MKLFTRFVLSVVAVYFAASCLPGIHITGFVSALIVTFVLAMFNVTLGYLLKILTFPINFLTLGLVGLVINVMMIALTDYFVEGFRTDGFLYALLFAVVLAVFNALIKLMFRKKK
ncbi:MAG: phage holin family protein [Bacteroidota bacterium]